MSENHSENLNVNPAPALERPRHWIGVEELNPEYWTDAKVREKRGQEFLDKPIETIAMIDKLDTKGIARRDFLTIMGASMAMASFACARRPVHKIIPYVVKPEEVTSAVANFYATACPDTGAAVLAKVREGRPVKLEGNPGIGFAKGATDTRTQAAILDLYDMDRAKEPFKMNRGKAASASAWSAIDQEVADRLKDIVAAGGGNVRVFTERVVSDSTQRLINEFLASFASGAHVQYSGMADDEVAAGQVESFGTNVVPYYDFAKADVVLSFGADFLCDWGGASTEYQGAWASTRRVDPNHAASAKQSKLLVCESMMTVTGANADERMPVRPGDELKIASAIAHEIGKRRGSVASQFASYTVEAVAKATGIDAARIRAFAETLNGAAGRSIVIAGGLSARTEDALALQIVTNYLNSILGNEGKTVDGTANPIVKVSQPVSDVLSLIQQMNQGQVDVLLIQGANPVYTLPKALGFAEAMGKVKLVIAFNDRADETSVLADYLMPDHHWLENWGDVQLRKGVVALQQPAVAPIHNTRSFQDSLIALSKAAALKGRGLLATGPASWYDYLKANWKETFRVGTELAWEQTLRDGGIKASVSMGGARSFRDTALAKVPTLKAASPGLVFAAYAKSGIGDGRQANNPWLQEFPDPVTTATWDNYLCMSPATAKKLSIEQNDVVTIKSGGIQLDLPVNVQPGLHPDTVAAAIGYGRTSAGKVGTGVGRDVKVLARVENGAVAFSGIPVEVKKTGRKYQIAITQWHWAAENRPIINDITLTEFRKDPKASLHTDPHLRLDPVPTMWPKYKYPGYRWGMAIDLTTCTGCGSCVIACQAENNIPVVGRDNVRRSREMHWLRIDRYYGGDESNPNVLFQPMLCQHCENAPCETVCPVLATVHDDEGMNSQVYNRCVGTRYCQNNCPYKVRRFNFFDHWKSYEGTMNLAWNPEVTVRTRGIMEKCTFCVQRIRDAKDKAKDEGRAVKDGEFTTACAQACATDAIVFGNINDPNSRVSQLRNQQHAFRSLEVLNTVPAISYLTKVRNAEHSGFAHHAGGHETDMNTKGEHQEQGGHHE